MRMVNDPCCRRLLVTWTPTEGERVITAAVTKAYVLGQMRENILTTLGQPPEGHTHEWGWSGLVKSESQGRMAVIRILFCSEAAAAKTDLVGVMRPILRNVLGMDNFTCEIESIAEID